MFCQRLLIELFWNNKKTSFMNESKKCKLSKFLPCFCLRLLCSPHCSWSFFLSLSPLAEGIYLGLILAISSHFLNVAFLVTLSHFPSLIYHLLTHSQNRYFWAHSVARWNYHEMDSLFSSNSNTVIKSELIKQSFSSASADGNIILALGS